MPYSEYALTSKASVEYATVLFDQGPLNGVTLAPVTIVIPAASRLLEIFSG